MGAVSEVARSVEQLAAVDPVGCDEPSIRSAMGTIQTQIRRLQSTQTSLAKQLTDRQARRLSPSDPDDRKVRQQAERDTQNELADTLNITHAEAKDAVQAGQALEGLSPATREAFEQGRITQRHARTLAQTIDSLLGVADRDTTETDLLEAARRLSSIEFGRHCRDLIARTDAEQSQRDLDRRRRDRYGRVFTDASGMVHIRAGLVGIEAEIAKTAIEVFRGKDQPDDLREPQHRTADAIFDALNHALRHAESTDHGNRPHVFVHVQADQLEDRATGVAETGMGETLPLTELGPVLDDCVITRIVKDQDSQVIDVGRATRIVPSAVWRGLVARDRACTLCGAPAQRCQAAHLGTRWTQGAGTSIREQALLCWRCHKIADHLKLQGRLDHSRVTWWQNIKDTWVRFHRWRRRTPNPA